MSPVGTTIFVVSVLLGYFVQGATGQSNACTQANRNRYLQGCLSAIRQRAEDRSFFWFGTSYFTRCPTMALRSTTIDCFSTHTTAKSLSSALFMINNADLSQLDRYIDVKYTSAPGSYTGCDYVYNQNKTKQFTLDPLSSTTYLPWDLRTLPELTWRSYPGDLFTLIMFDAGFGVVHAFYVNIPGTNIGRANAIFPYRGPGNFRDVPNPYVFVLYKQSTFVNANSIRLPLVAPLNIAFINVTQYAETYRLGRLVGMTWLRASYDAYAVQVQADVGAVQNCASLVKDALINAGHPQRSFLPKRPDLSVFLRMRLTSDALTYECDNTTIYQEAADFYVDPLGAPVLNTATTRTGATKTFTMQMNKPYPKNTIDFTGKMYSLAFVDADISSYFAMFGNSDLPFLHGLTINIPGNDVASGTPLASYFGPGPRSVTPHYYDFLLYEQPGTLQITNTSAYSESKTCPPPVAGRCFFNVAKFVSSNNLKLVGATWLRAAIDDYVTCSGGAIVSPVVLPILYTLASIVVAFNI